MVNRLKPSLLCQSDEAHQQYHLKIRRRDFRVLLEDGKAENYIILPGLMILEIFV
jgi:hypothetical protein